MTGEQIKEKVIVDLANTMRSDVRSSILARLEQIEIVLDKGNNVEIRKNPKGEVVILEVSKRNIR